MKIALTQNKYAVIDDQDSKLVQGVHWSYQRDDHGKEYAVHKSKVKGKYTALYMHRLLMKAKPGQYVDHKDNNGLNNTRSNLRIATMSQNIQNSKKKPGCTSQYKGVTWNKALGKWRSSINNQFLGYFDHERHAAIVYDLNALYLYGEFARTNFTAICSGAKSDVVLSEDHQ